jgi:hypothetical protein
VAELARVVFPETERFGLLYTIAKCESGLPLPRKQQTYELLYPSLEKSSCSTNPQKGECLRTIQKNFDSNATRIGR